MTTEKMTVHKALAELKIIDERIRSAVSEATGVYAVKHSATKVNGMTIKDFSDYIESGYKRANDLIRRRDAIKRAVVQSNAVTTVDINGDEYTIAEAIDMKNHSNDFRRMLLASMSRKYNTAIQDFEDNNGDKLEKRAEQYVLAIIQAQPKDSKMSADSEAMKSIRQTYIDNNHYDLIDPLKIQDKIKDLNDEISSFDAEVDAALSVSNALTVIEVSY